MAYKTRPGVTRVKVCGTSLLVPTRAASKECPHVTRLSFLGGLIWRFLESGHSMQDVYTLYATFTHKSNQEVERDVAAFLGMLCDNGFLIEVPDEDDDNDGD